MNKNTIKLLTKYAMVMTLYVVITWAFSFMSFASIQFRISEALVLLVFYDKKYFFPLVLGCILANLFSPFGVIDIIFGTIATIIGLLGIMISKKLWIASLFPVLANGIIVGLELCYFNGSITFNSFMFNFLTVSLGEFVCVSILGVLIFKSIENRPFFTYLIDKKGKSDDKSDDK